MIETDNITEHTISNNIRLLSYIEHLSEESVQDLLATIELCCLAKHLSYKFPDTKYSISDLVNIIIEELLNNNLSSFNYLKEKERSNDKT